MFKTTNPTTSHQDSDEVLLARYVQTGSGEVLGVLYTRYIPMVYGVCLKVLKDTNKAQDAVMGIYETLTKKAKEHNIESFRGWLYVLARNYCLMEWRKDQRRPTDYLAPEDIQKYDSTEMEDEYELPNTQSSLEKCLEVLPENQKQCVLLFYYEDKSYKEIADQTTEDIGKVRSFIQNGKRNLKNCMERLGTVAE